MDDQDRSSLTAALGGPSRGGAAAALQQPPAERVATPPTPKPSTATPAVAAKPALPTQAPQQAMPPLPESFKSWGQDAQTYMALIGMLAGIAGAVSRNHATTALNALGSGLTGLREGEKEKADRDYKVWRASTQEVLVQNKLARDQYEKVLKDKDLTYEQKVQQLKLLSSQHQDEITYKAASVGDMRQIDAALQRRAMLGDQVESAFDRIENHKRELDKYVLNHGQKRKKPPKDEGQPQDTREGDDLPRAQAGSPSLPRMNLFG